MTLNASIITEKWRMSTNASVYQNSDSDMHKVSGTGGGLQRR